MSKFDYYYEQKQAAKVFLSIALILLLVFIGFFVWHTVRMRSYELNYERIQGTVVDVEKTYTRNVSTKGNRAVYFLVISYTYEGREYTFTDRVGYYTQPKKMGISTEIYVNPQNPSQAEKVTSSDVISEISACFFAFFCVTYAAGSNVLLSIKGSTFKKRFMYVWGIELLLGIVFLLLFWLGLPHSGFGEIFVRIRGAVGITVILCLLLCVIILDKVITHKLHSKKRIKTD